MKLKILLILASRKHDSVENIGLLQNSFGSATSACSDTKEEKESMKSNMCIKNIDCEVEEIGEFDASHEVDAHRACDLNDNLNYDDQCLSGFSEVASKS